MQFNKKTLLRNVPNSWIKEYHLDHLKLKSNSSK